MTRDNEIQTLLKNYKPDTAKSEFMEELKQKMDVVDMVRSEHESIRRFHRMVSVFCLLIGFTIGTLLMAIASTHPFGLAPGADPTVLADMPSHMAGLCARYSDLALTLTGAIFLAGGLITAIRLSSWFGVPATENSGI